MGTEQNEKWWRQGRWVPLALLGFYLLSMVAIFYYVTLPEPRYIRPHTADDWAAWGTWLGAGFTGGALIFAGRQFRSQSDALNLEVKLARANEAEAQRRRLAVAQQAHVEWSHKIHDEVLALESLDERMSRDPSSHTGPAFPVQNRYVQAYETTISFLAPPGGVIANVVLHLPEHPLEAADRSEENLADIEMALQAEIPIVRSLTVQWVDRPRPVRDRPGVVFHGNPVETTRPSIDALDASAKLVGVKQGERLSISAFTAHPAGQDLYFTFSDSSGSWFRLSSNGSVSEIPEPI